MTVTVTAAWRRHRSATTTTAVDQPAAAPDAAPTREERWRTNQDRLAALVEAGPADQRRARNIEAVIADLKRDGQHLKGTRLTAVRCSTAACTLDFFSESPQQQQAIGPDLAATSFADQFRAVSPARDRPTTRVYLAAFSKRPAGAVAPVEWAERTARALARIHPELGPNRTEENLRRIP